MITPGSTNVFADVLKKITFTLSESVIELALLKKLHLCLMDLYH